MAKREKIGSSSVLPEKPAKLIGRVDRELRLEEIMRTPEGETSVEYPVDTSGFDEILHRYANIPADLLLQ
ncbi:MAG TPA: hypothetical protein VJL83_02985 [Patescibacteria group bacterium]|nr:hypothetical protein [Patescibacteria group bacterium]